MMDDTFAAQYKNPMWQKKRLEALDDAGFECQNCGSKEKQLHVHHHRYVKGRKVWEYENYELAVLCDACHEILHEQKEHLQKILVGQTNLANIVCNTMGFIDASKNSVMPYDADKFIPKSYLAGFLAQKLLLTEQSFIIDLEKTVNQLYSKWQKKQRKKDNVSEGETK